MWAATLVAAPPREWEVIRVFIRDEPDQIERLVTPAYATVLIDDLSRELIEEEQSRKQSSLDSLALEEAIYLARLDGDFITSDRSRWMLRGKRTAQPLELGNISMAIRAARGISPDNVQLTERTQYTPAGVVELNHRDGINDYWFGFSAMSTRQGNQRRFRFQVPPAATGKLLLSVPKTIELSSPTVVVERIASATAFLPKDWPADPSQTSSTVSQWWLVHLAGVDAFDLFAASTDADDSSLYKHLLRSASVDYILSPQLLESRARFLVRRYSGSTPLRLQVGNEFKIESVLADGLPAKWRVKPSPAEALNFIELVDLEITSQDIVLEVRTACSIKTSKNISLPELGIAHAYAQSGRSRVYGRDGTVIDDLVAAGAQLRRAADIGNGTNNQASGLLWQIDWLGNAPRLQTSVAAEQHPLTARSLTRFTVQADLISANCRMRIDSRNLASNEIRLPVGRNWFVDSVKLLQTNANIRARVEDRKNAASPTIVIYWEGIRDQVSLDLEVVAHIPRDVNTDAIELRSPRLVTVPNADQVDNYSIETASRFSVQMSADLLAYQVGTSQLPFWQQQLLPQLSEKRIFQGVRGTIPPIKLTASSGTFSSTVSAVLKRDGERVSLQTQIKCLPTSGAIDQVALMLPSTMRENLGTWSLLTEDSVEPIKLEVSVASNSANSDKLDQELMLELPLPGALGNPFTLISEVEIDVSYSDDFSIAIVGLPSTTQGETILIMPREFAATLDNVEIELMPAAVCCSDSDFTAILGDLNADQRSQWVAARLKSSVSHLLHLHSHAQSENGGWVWKEAIQHRILESGEVSHDAQWVVEGAASQAFEVNLPIEWQLAHAWINDQPIEIPAAQRIVRFDIDDHDKSTIRIQCYSQHEPPKWLSYERLPLPKVSLPVLESQSSLTIPPSRIALGSIRAAFTEANAPSRLLDRLTPRKWWSLLAPLVELETKPIAVSLQRESESSFSVGWSKVDLGGDTRQLIAASDEVNSPGEWTINRNALSAMTLAAVLGMVATIWMFIGTAVKRWWLALSLCCIATIVVPPTQLPFVQLLLLSTSLAALIRLGGLVRELKSNGSRPRGRSAVVNLTRTTAGIGLMLATCAPANGQGPFRSIQDEQLRATSKSPAEEPGELTPEIYSVLIPIDDSGNVSGYAYVPIRLLELLEGGNEAAGIALPPKILSADYTLRTKPGLPGQIDQLQELTAEFRLQVAQAETEIRLPFDSSQVTLLRGSEAGQELFVGGRDLSQTFDAIAFRPSTTGVVSLQLQLRPQVIPLNSQTTIKCSIPPIPNATLRIVADGNSVFEVKSTGMSRKAVSSVSTELIGPVEVLEVAWSASAARTALGQQPPAVFADTWLQARDHQIAAVCQLRIDNAGVLPRELHVVAEPGWEPVGRSWGDGELIYEETSSLGGRRVFTVRCAENWGDAPTRTIRVLMVPRDPEATGSLLLPFFSLREVSQQAVTRTLAWSSEENAIWRPEGLEFWQELVNVPGLEWGDLGWSTKPRLYSVIGAMGTTLRRVSDQNQNTIDEFTDVHLNKNEARINYRAQCLVPETRMVVLTAPKNSRVDSVSIDGSPAVFRVADAGTHSIIEVQSGENPGGYEKVEVSLALPLDFNRSIKLPRLFMRNFEASSSAYSLYRGAGINCELQTEDSLTLEPANSSTTDELTNLETLLGNIELGNSYRDAPWLPTSFKLTRRSQPPLLGSVMTIVRRQDQSWKATVTTAWKTDVLPLDFAFFELPVAVRDTVDAGQLPAQLVPFGDSLTLRLIPPKPIEGITKVEFSFLLPTATANQVLTIPHVAVLTSSRVTPILGLPTTIDTNRVNWAQTGRKLDDISSELIRSEEQSETVYFTAEAAQSKVSWRTSETTSRSAELLLSRVVLLNHRLGNVSGYIDYWIAPNGLLSLPITLPPHCEVLGVELGNQPAVWRIEKQRLSVLMQPNTMPVHLQLLVHWKSNNKVSGGANTALRLPIVELANTTTKTLSIVESRLEDLEIKATGPREEPRNVQAVYANCWAELLLDHFSSISTNSSSEVLLWLQQWYPSQVELEGTETIEPKIFEQAMNSLGIDNGGDNGGEQFSTTTAEELWQSLRLQAGEQSADIAWGNDSAGWQTSDLVGKNVPLPDSEPHESKLLNVAQGEILLRSIPAATSNWMSRTIAATLIALASLLTLLVAKRLGGFVLQLVSAHPWLYWFFLAAMAWLPLPVEWPSWVLCFAALWMLISQSLESRRRSRLLSRV